MGYTKKLIGYRDYHYSSELDQAIKSDKESLQSLINDLVNYTDVIDEATYREIVKNGGKQLVDKFRDYYNKLPLHPIQSRAKAQQEEHSLIVQEIERLCKAIQGFKGYDGVDINTFSFKDGKVEPIESVVKELRKEYLSIYLLNQEQEDAYNKLSQIVKELNKLRKELRKEYASSNLIPGDDLRNLNALIKDKEGNIKVNPYYFAYHKIK